MNHEQLRFDDMQPPPIELVAQNDVKSPNPILSNPYKEVEMNATERYFQELGGRRDEKAVARFYIEKMRRTLLEQPDILKKQK